MGAGVATITIGSGEKRGGVGGIGEGGARESKR